MGEFISRRIFNEEPAFKENHVWATLSVQWLIGPIFVEKNVDGPVYRKILKKEAFPQFKALKNFSKFWFQQDGAKAHTVDLTLDLVETHFKKRVISNHFPLKKKRGAEVGRRTPQSQSFGLFPLGLYKGPVLGKQTDNDFGSAKKYHQHF